MYLIDGEFNGKQQRESYLML